MQSTSKLTVIAAALVVVVIVFGNSSYTTDVIWLGVALFGVVAMLVLHLTEASERLPYTILRLVPRLLLSVSSLAVGVLVLATLYHAAANDELSGWNVFYVIGVCFVAGLFLFVGVSWARKAVANATQNGSTNHIESQTPKDLGGN